MTYLILVAFVAILASLGVALYFMLRGDQANATEHKANPMSKALAFRVGISVALFVCVLLAYWAGWIQPTGLAHHG